MVISDERKNKDTHLQKLRVPRHKGNGFFTFNRLPGHPQLFQTPIFSPLISAQSCYILLSFQRVQLLTPCVFLSPSFCSGCCLHQLFTASAETDADASRETAERSLQVN